MKKIVWTYGLISGAICIVMILGSSALLKNNIDAGADFGKLEWIGFATIILAFVLIYFAQAAYRDRIGNGVISFGKAFQIGLFISIIASLCYVLAWMVISRYFFPDFMDQYAAYELGKLEEKGASATTIAKRTEEMQKYKELYKNPLINAMATFLEPFPVGLIIGFISSFVVRLKKRARPKHL